MNRDLVHKCKKYGLLLSLYLCQGLPFGFFIQGGPAILRKQGASLKEITLLSAFALPYAFKPLWAPIIDNTLTRATWIRCLQILTLVALACFALAPEVDIYRLCAFFLIANLLAATQDIATDGLAVNVLAPSERGVGNAIQVGGYRVGMILGGGYVLGFFEELNWSGCFWLIAGLFLVASLPSFLPWFSSILEETHEDSHNENTTAAESENRGEVTESKEEAKSENPTLSFFRQPGILGWLFIVVLIKQADYMASGVVKPWLVDLGVNLKDISYYYGTVGSVAGLTGAVLGGPFVQRVGRLRGIIVLFFLQYLCLLHSCYLAWFNDVSANQLMINSVLEHLPGGMATVALFTCMMDVCRPKYAGHDYSWQASILVFVNIAANSMSGRMAAATGYTSHFITSCQFGLFSVLCIIIWARVSRGPALFADAKIE